jgi:predicted PurR-regulated permease PerM
MMCLGMMYEREGVWAIPSQPSQSIPPKSDQPIPERVIARIELPWRTVAKVILTIAILWLIVRLWSILLLLLIGMLLTAALNPAVVWLQKRGLGRSAAVSVVLLGLLAVFALFLLILIPPIVDETGKFIDDLPAQVERTQGLLQKRYPSLYERLQTFAQRQAEGGAIPLNLPVPRILSAGAGIVQGISNAVIALVITAYLLVDGARIYRWTVRYLPDDQEAKVRQALPEISQVVSGYVVGQVITSLLFGIFTFVVLSIAGVPQPLFLALLAAIFDAIPIVGVFIATIPAVLLALTVSVPTAIVVLVAYVVYQQVENYVIVPRVYRDTLRISSFAVLIAVIIGSELLGIIGVLIALPIAAALPVVERIWINTAPKPSSVADPAPPESSSEPA